MKNKVILITGSSNGIGRETAFKFASEKAKVVLTLKFSFSFFSSFKKIPIFSE